jgi:GNAT superfamily N-acetyltransferase
VSINALEKIHPLKEHYYFQFIGVAPDYQNKGIGTALMQSVFEKCDHEGCGAYLENTLKANIPYYQHRGFILTEEVDLGGGAPLVWPMWRDPQ